MFVHQGYWLVPFLLKANMFFFSSSFPSCLFRSLLLVSTDAACVLSLVFGLVCGEMKGRGRRTDGYVGLYGDVLRVSGEEHPLGMKGEEEMKS